jgi:hypothetical protein
MQSPMRLLRQLNILPHWAGCRTCSWPIFRALVHDHTLQLSYPQRIQWQVCGGAGGRMPVTVQIQFESAVTETSSIFWLVY